jgi:hypothetical protein
MSICHFSFLRHTFFKTLAMYVYHNGVESGWSRPMDQLANPMDQLANPARVRSEAEWSYYPNNGDVILKI